MTLSTNFYFAQKIADKEYEIYSTYIGEQGLANYPIILDIPEKFHIESIFDDPIAKEVNKIPSYELDKKKLRLMSLKYEIKDKNNQRIRFDSNLTIYFSSIYFNNSNEGYFFVVYEHKNVKPFYLFYKALYKNNRWDILFYNEVY